MKDRIQEILNSENLTRTRFAELINIQASAVTHIINGRNKPSMDVVQSILTVFPKINPEWLILGTGNMYKNDTQQQQNQSINIKTTKSEPFMRTLFDDIPTDEPENSTQNELTAPASNNGSSVTETKTKTTNVRENVSTNSNPIVNKRQEEAPQDSSLHKQNQNPISQQDPIITQQPPIQQIATTVAAQPRTIKKIIILYSDNTFEELSK